MDNKGWIALGLVGLHGAHEMHLAFEPTRVNGESQVIEQYRMPSLPHGFESTSGSTQIAPVWAIAAVTTSLSTISSQPFYAGSGWPPVLYVKV